MVKEWLPVLGGLVMAMVVLSGCVSKNYSLGDVPKSSSYKNIKAPEIKNDPREMAKTSVDPDGSVVGVQIEQHFNPSLLTTLDYQLGVLEVTESNKKPVVIDKLTIRYIDPNMFDTNFYLQGAIGVAMIESMHKHAITPDNGKDSLLCYIKGTYRGRKVIVKQFVSCPDDNRNCFASSPLLSKIDTSFPYTKNAAQELAKECISEFVAKIDLIKASAEMSGVP